MPLFTQIAATTEREAVNTILGSIGESPLAEDFDFSEVPLPSDVESVIQILRETIREAQAMGWRFNSFESVPVYPSGILVEATGVLNIFKQPPGVLSWSTVHCRENADYDPVVRLSTAHQENGEFVPVLFDRTHHRDGPDREKVPVLYLDTINAVDFELCPETFRQFVVIRAARRFGQRVPGSPTLSSFQERDEATAYRNLKFDQQAQPNPNIFDDPSMALGRGGRWDLGRPYRRIRRT